MGTLRTVRTLTLLGAVLLAAAGCASDGSGPAGSPSAGSASTRAVVLEDGWAKAATTGMTSVFGTLRNGTAAPVTVISASASLAGRVELHETVTVNGVAQMQPRAGGFAIPAGGSLALAPGGNHLMLMDLNAPVRPGDDVVLTLRLKDGTEVVVHALGKEFAGAKESYQPSMSAMAGS